MNIGSSTSKIKGVVISSNNFAPMGELSTTENTKITYLTEDIWNKVNATWVNNSLNMDFIGNSTGSLIYTGSEEKFFHIASTISLSSQGALDIAEATIFKNGVILTPGIVEFKLGAIGDTQSSAIHVATNLSYGDRLDLYVKNEADNDDFVIKYANMFAMGMPTEDDLTPPASVPVVVSVDFSSLPKGYTQDWFNLSNVPTGMFVMNGTPLDRATYPECFSYLGIQFGNTSNTNFNLPDVRGRNIVYANQTGILSTIGSTGGEINHTLLDKELPALYSLYTVELIRRGTGAFFSNYVLDAVGINSVQNIQGATSVGTSTPHNVMDPYIIQGGKIIRC
jgi:microcystin-dependent protein